MKHKKIFIAFTAVFTVILAVVIFLLTWFWADTYEGFSDFSQEFEIAGLDDGATPQGLASYRGDEQYFFTTAYFADGTPSRIYVTGQTSGNIGYVSLKDESGKDFYGHSGGIAVSADGRFVWIASEKTVYVIGGAKGTAENIVSLAKSNGDEAGGAAEIAFTASFNSNLSEAAFLYYYDNPNYTSASYDRLYVGEFYREGNYETDEKHRLTTPAGDYNTAFIYEYKYNSSNTDFGVYKISSALKANLADGCDAPLINAVYSITEKIQGFAIANGKLALSQSYGLANSHVLVYDWSKVTATANRDKLSEAVGSNLNYEGVKTENGAQVTTGSSGLSTIYLYYIDGGVLTDDYDIPSMSEGLCAVDKKVYVLFESGSMKYRRYVRKTLSNVYSVTL